MCMCLLHILKSLQKLKVFCGTSMIIIDSNLAVTFTVAYSMERTCNLALNAEICCIWKCFILHMSWLDS